MAYVGKSNAVTFYYGTGTFNWPVGVECVWVTGCGGGGGGGGAGNAGNPGTGSGNPGNVGSSATYSCLTVSGGSSYPVTVGPGGFATISWDPQ